MSPFYRSLVAFVVAMVKLVMEKSSKEAKLGIVKAGFDLCTNLGAEEAAEEIKAYLPAEELPADDPAPEGDENGG